MWRIATSSTPSPSSTSRRSEARRGSRADTSGFRLQQGGRGTEHQRLAERSRGAVQRRAKWFVLLHWLGMP